MVFDGFAHWDTGPVSRGGGGSPVDSRVSGVQDDVARLNARIDRFKLVNRALWELVRDNTSLTEAMLEAKAKEIDARDGAEDGRDSQAIRNCQRCGKVVQRGQERCQYCGATQGYDTIFDWVR